jgi:hypothetical protein
MRIIVEPWSKEGDVQGELAACGLDRFLYFIGGKMEGVESGFHRSAKK